jgi:D-glycero-alpha-D-manno-heptose 1-phosphate guanylyltransferase
MRAIVLAGGRGTRLQSVLPDLPKPMAPIAGRPFLEYILDRLIDGGIENIVLSVGYKADVIISHFENRYRGATLHYSVEHEPLGTGGGIAYALSLMETAPVLVVNGDTFLDIDYRELVGWYEEEPSQIAMVLRNVSDVSRYGSVLLSNHRVTDLIEKGIEGPGLINAGIYILEPGIFAAFGLSGNFALETDVLQKHCGTLSPRAFVSDSYFVDIGVPEDYERAEDELPTVLQETEQR